MSGGISELERALALASALSRRGAAHIFGLPGTQNVALFEALRRSSIRTIVPTHELAAAFMAGAYYRVSGQPGILATIPGPGLGLALNGLAEAWLDSAAMLCITHAAPWDTRPGHGPQALRQRALLRAVTKAIVSAPSLRRVGEAVEVAWELSICGEPGPVAIEIGAEASAADLKVEQGDATHVEGPSEADIAAAWGMIRAASRPLIVAGQGVIGVADAFRTLVEKLGAPVVTTPSARGVLPENDRLAMGFDALKGAVAAANDLIARADVVVVLGAKLAHNGSAGGRLHIPRDKLVRVDTSAAVLAAGYPAAHGLVMDVGEFLACKDAKGIGPARWSSLEIASARAALRTLDARDEPLVAGARPGAFFAALSAALPHNVRLVTDTGFHQVMARRHMDVLAPGGLLMPSDLQSMGFGLPAAIAARLADPTRPVVALIGDGGLRMSGFEIGTAVRERIALTVIVLNDQSLNQIRLQQLQQYGAAHGTELGALDIAAFADAVGSEHVLVDTPEAMRSALAGAGDPKGVRIIEVPVHDSARIRAGALKAAAKRTARKVLGSGISARLQALLPTGR